MRTMIVVSSLLGTLFAGAFLVSFVCVFAGPAYPDVANRVCFPLSDPEDVAVDRAGRVFVALPFYGRIQVYGVDGDFRSGFFARGVEGICRIRFNEDGLLEVAAARSRDVLIYDPSGAMIRKVPKAALIGPDGVNFTSGGQKGYRIVSHWLNPRVVGLEEGRGVVVIETPFFLKPLAGPVPCFSLAVCTSLVSHYLRRRAKKEGKRGGEERGKRLS